jgi:hypothetical protein
VTGGEWPGLRNWRGPGLRLAAALLPPLVVFAGVRWLFAMSAERVWFDPWNPLSWRRWDSGHYLDIAVKGWEFFSCARIHGRPEDACGNAAWFPLYPWLLRPLIAVGLRPETAGVWLSGTAALAMLVLFWNGLLRERGLKGFVLLAMAGVFPGAVYAHAIFPTGVAQLCMIAAGVALVRRRWALAGLGGGFLSMTYVTGVLLSAPSAIAAWLRARSLRPAFVVGGLSALGFVAVLLAQQVLLGHWDAWIRTYQKGLPGLWHPLAGYWDVIDKVATADIQRRTIGLQALTVLGLLLLGLGTTAVMRTWKDPQRAWAAMTALLYWAFPLVAGRGLSLYRADALVLPVLLLLVDLPLWLLVPLLAWLVAVAFSMSQLFFNGYLV